MVAAGADSDARFEALAEYGVLGTPPEEAYDLLVVDAARCFGVDRAAITFFGPQGRWRKAWLGRMSQASALAASFCSHVLHHDALLVVPDASVDARFADNDSVTGSEHVRFYAGVPIRTPAGLPVGVLSVSDVAPRPRGATDDETTLLRVLADKAAAQLELARLCRVQAELSDCTDGEEPQGGVSDPVLSARQTEVLNWASLGKSAAETADILALSPRTIRFHLAAAAERLGVSRTTQAVASALARGLISGDPAD